jgi:hypothetical protein
VGDGFVAGLGVAQAAFGGGDAGAGSDVVKLHEDLAGFDVVALLNVDDANRGCEGAVEFNLLDGFDEAVGADGVDEFSAGGGGGADGQIIASEAAGYEENNDQQNGSADPQPNSTFLRALLCHARDVSWTGSLWCALHSDAYDSKASI